MDYVTFFRIIEHEFQYIDTLSHGLKCGTAISVRQLLFFIAKKSNPKSLVQKKAIASHRFIQFNNLSYFCVIVSLSSYFASRIVILNLSGSLSIMLFL